MCTVPQFIGAFPLSGLYCVVHGSILMILGSVLWRFEDMSAHVDLKGVVDTLSGCITNT